MTGSSRNSKNSRSAAAWALIAAVATGVLVATALASGGSHVGVHRGDRTTIDVFSRPPAHIARIARAGSLNPPPGSILASVIGRNQVFALHTSGGEDCVINLHVGAGGGSVCSPAKRAEEQGAVGIFQEGEGATAAGSPPTLRVAVLVPDGVMSIHFTRRDGSSYDVPVTSNVAESEGLAIASVSYRLPGGGSRMTDVAATVDDSPSQPGAPGSTRTASH
jgi:hypothetical protein